MRQEFIKVTAGSFGRYLHVADKLVSDQDILAALKSEAPWAAEFRRVKSGYHAFESVSDARSWDGQD